MLRKENPKNDLMLDAENLFILQITRESERNRCPEADEKGFAISHFWKEEVVDVDM